MRSSLTAAATAWLLLANTAPDVSWPVHGATPLEQRYSPLDQINEANVARLGLGWTYEFDTNRGQEATPIVVGGVMYVSSAWSKVFALDARTGRLLWKFDPQNAGEKGVHACCDVGNRGVAVSQGRVFVGAIDGRLIALDARSGKKLWDVRTAPFEQPYTITGAPRVVRDKVIIGNGGAELGVRGFVTAYDVATGKKIWRFYTVPGDPAKGPDHEVSDAPLARYANGTWFGDWYKYGGGGTVWDAIVYDPELNLLYLGVGNGSPWNWKVRSAGKGDNLFLSSIVALDPDTGEYRWHYQETPGESWDYTATQPILLATLPIDGKPRKVLLHAPKNGFFYVIDRATGKLLSAKNYVPVNWATGIDMKTGRPIETSFARYPDGPTTIYPSGLGGHTWHPMAFHPRTGLVYIPAIYASLTFSDQANFAYRPGRWNTAANFGGPPPAGDHGIPPADATPGETGALLAWDPIAQKARWSVPIPTVYNGGVLAAGRNLVFEGTRLGEFAAYAADSGKKLWNVAVGNGIIAPPVTYRLDGVQYVAVVVGPGGAAPISRKRGEPELQMPNGRVLVFKLGGKLAMPEGAHLPLPTPTPSNEAFTDAQIEHGRALFFNGCSVCHGGYILPEVPRSTTIADAASFRAVVLDGVLSSRGMASWKDYLSAKDVEDIRAWANDEARRILAKK
jgi:PQQ-dependent dehydrogenase (methanol/ethanol family)